MHCIVRWTALCLLLTAPAALAQAEVDLYEHEKDVAGAAFSDDGALLASVSEKEIHVHDARSWEPVRSFKIPGRHIGITPDGKRLGLAADKALVYELGPDLASRFWPKSGDALPSPNVQLTRHGLFFGTLGGDVTRLDPVQGTVLWTKSGAHERGEVWVHTTLNGRFLASCGGKRVIVWDALKGTELHRFEQEGTCASVAIAEDGAVLVTGSTSKVFVWDVKAGAVRETILTTGESLAISRDGRRLALGTPTAFTLWDVPSVTALAVIPGSARVFTFSPDGRRVVTARRDKGYVLRIYDVEALLAAPWNQTVSALRGLTPSRSSSAQDPRPAGRSESAGLRGQVGHEFGVVAVRVSADGKTLWSSAKPSEAGKFVTKVWDVAARRVLRHHPGVVADVAPRGDLAMVEHDGSTTLLDQTGAEVGKLDGGALLSAPGSVMGLADGAVTVRGRDGRVRTGPALPDVPSQIAASDDGKVIVVVSDKIATTIDGGTLKARRELVGHTKPISEIAVARTGKVIVTMSEEEGKAIAWDAATGRLLAEHPFTEKVRAIAVDGSGALAALGLVSGDVVVWETRTGKLQLRVPSIAGLMGESVGRGLAPDVTSLDFAADGTLFIGSLDRSIRIWDTKKKKPVARLTGFIEHGQLIDETLEPPAPPFTATSGRLHRDLVDACADGKDDEAARLLGKLGPVNLEFETRGWTALAVCAAYNNPKATRLLLERGANTEFQLKQRETALMQATVRDHVDVVRALLAGGADVGARRTDGAMALHLALCRDKPAPRALVTALLDAKADPNAAGPTKQTALHCAARTSPADVVGLVLERGARVDVKDADGFTPLAHAEDLGRRDVVAVLQRAPSPPAVTPPAPAVTQPPATPSPESAPPTPAAPPTCPPDASWNGTVCVATAVSCPAGTTWDGTTCMAASVTCPPESTWNGQVCQPSEKVVARSHIVFRDGIPLVHVADSLKVEVEERLGRVAKDQLPGAWRLAREAASAGQTERALDYAVAAVIEGSGSGEIEVFHQLGRRDLLLAALDRRLEGRPGSDNWKDYFELLSEDAAYRAAFLSWITAQPAGSLDAYFLAQAAGFLAKLKDTEKACALLAEANERAYDIDRSRYGFGEWRVLNCDPERMLKVMKKRLEDHPDDITALLWILDLLEHTGRQSELCTWAKKAGDVRPNSYWKRDLTAKHCKGPFGLF